MILFIFVLIILFLVRIVNLHYNSPFNDEAIYVVLGRLGVFQNDWGTYNASNWVAGSVYIYPVLSALSYMLFGIVGSRFLNVIFGLIAIESVFTITTLLTKKTNKTLPGALIASLLIGTAAVSLYVSRLATYDMPSFCFLLLSMRFFLKARSGVASGKAYFLSSVFLFLSFATKIIIGFYLPILLVVTYFSVKDIPGRHLFFWKRYFLLPLGFGLGMYALTTLGGNLTYLSTQVRREYASWEVILREVWRNSTYLWGFYALGSLGLLIQKEWKKWFLLSLLGVWIVLLHLATHRLTTLDKHLYLLIAGLAVITGVGVNNIISINKRIVGRLVLPVIAACTIAFSVYSYSDAQRFNSQWKNSSDVSTYLESEVKPGQKVLTEIGPNTMLGLYDVDHPTNVTTFDWFEYRNFKGTTTYAEAVKDGYFNYIEVEDTETANASNSVYKAVDQEVKKYLADSYRLVYAKNGHLIYRREY